MGVMAHRNAHIWGRPSHCATSGARPAGAVIADHRGLAPSKCRERRGQARLRCPRPAPQPECYPLLQGGHLWVALPKIIAVWGKVSKGRHHNSITIGVQLKNSSDLSLGRRPESKSEEFSSCTPKVDQIITILGLKPLKKCYTVREHDPVCRAVICLLTNV